MPTVRPPFFFRWLSPDYLVCDLPGPGKVIYLTFDDGPIPEVTPEILGILRQYNAKATFFMVGENIRKHPGIFESVKVEGHEIGNHSCHHLNGWHTSPGAYINDVYLFRKYSDTRLFRPPYGRFTPSQYFLLRKDFRFVLWSVLTCDFHANTSRSKCLENAINHTGNGAVVVFHDSLKARDNVLYALPKFLEHFTSLGYHFNPLDQFP